MPRPILRTEKQKTQESLSIRAPRQGPRTKTVPRNVDRLLLKTRSPAYVKVMTALDTGDKTTGQRAADEIMDAIRAEFPNIDVEGMLLGIVAMCYLGEDYEVHTLDLSGMIIQHFRRGQPMPARLEAARSLAMCGSYAFVEVYDNGLRPVTGDGMVTYCPSGNRF